MAPALRRYLTAILRAVLRSLRGGSLLHAQAVAFNMFMAFFPALLFLAGVLGYAEATLEDMVEGLQFLLPPGSRRVVVDSLLALSKNPGRLLLVGAVGTMLMGSQLMFSLGRIFAALYQTEERRGFWHWQLLSFAMVFVTVIPWATISVLVVFGRFLRAWIVESLGAELSRWVVWVSSAGYYALVVVTVLLVLATLYYFLTPGHRLRWHDVLPGAALAMALWWIVTSLFAYYVQRLAIYNALYGGLAAAIGLLIWMYLSAVVILIGAQYNRELSGKQGNSSDRQNRAQAGTEREAKS